jgi:NAD(P)-dependent dehydrogenase (short-subunit alcohol dehydrogenase family)
MGLESAIHLGRAGWTVYGTVLTDSEANTLATTAAERGTPVHVVRMDLTRDEDISAAVRQIDTAEGRLDALVHFAGMGLRGFFEDLSLDEIRRVYDVNVFGTMALTRAVLPRMRAQRAGRIIVTTSIAGRIGSMSISGYASSKFALEGFAECLSQELAPLGISVSLLEPGLIRTEHFTHNRNRAQQAVDPASPYYAWFCQHEQIVDDILRRNKFTTADIAVLVEQILEARRPRLRYVVGAKAKAVLLLRRLLPGELFERFYFGLVRRMVTSPRRQAAGLSSTVDCSSSPTPGRRSPLRLRQ